MAHSHTAPENISRVSVDPAEMESFSRMAENWWDPKGPFKPLHIMNGARLGFIKETLCEHYYGYWILAAAGACFVSPSPDWAHR